MTLFTYIIPPKSRFNNGYKIDKKKMKCKKNCEWVFNFKNMKKMPKGEMEKMLLFMSLVAWHRVWGQRLNLRW